MRAAIATPFGEIRKAVDVLNRFRDAPMGRVRLSVHNEAADFLVSPVLPVFLERFPDARRVEVASHWNIPGLHKDRKAAEDWLPIKKGVLVLGVRAHVLTALRFLERP